MWTGARRRGSRFVPLPDVREVRAHQHQVARLQFGEVVAHHPVSRAVQGEDQLVLGVKMPGTREAAAADLLEGESLLGTGHQLLKNEFHGAVVASGRESITTRGKACSQKRARQGSIASDTLPP